MNKSVDEIIKDIAEVLEGASGEFVAEIANKVLGRNAGYSDKEVTYNGDSMFTVETAVDHYTAPKDRK